MTLDLGAVGYQAGQFNGCAADIRTAIKQIRSYQDQLNCAWSGDEMHFVNAEIDHICSLLSQSVADIGGLADDVRRVGGAVRREQDVAEAKARTSKKGK